MKTGAEAYREVQALAPQPRRKSIMSTDKERIETAVNVANALSYHHPLEGKAKHNLYDLAQRLSYRSVWREGRMWHDHAGRKRSATLFERFAHRVAGLVPQRLF